MTRVLLLGAGPLPTPNPKHVDFPMLRTWQFLRGLLEADVDVWLVQSVSGRRVPRWRERRFEGKRIHVLSLAEPDFDRADGPARWVDRCRPDVVVSAGPYRTARAAARVPRPVPTLIDLPGDPMAEAHLRATLTGDDSHLEHARRLMDAVLWRGDAFAVVSNPQRYATLGALGLWGRLPDSGAGPGLVQVVPVGIEPLWEAWAARGDGTAAREPDKIIWPGSFNTWAATDTFVDACEIAMARNPNLHVVATGGPIKNHAESVHAGVVSRVAASPRRNRWKLTGWLPASRAAAEVGTATLGVMLDKPCAESELGSRTRLLYGAVLGLRWLVTPRCELARQLVEQGLARPVWSLDPEEVADAILEETAIASSRDPDPDSVGRLWESFGPAVATEPLVAWVLSPSSLSPEKSGVVSASASRLIELERSLSEIHHSVTWRTLSSIHRVFIALRNRNSTYRVATGRSRAAGGRGTGSDFVDMLKKDR